MSLVAGALSAIFATQAAAEPPKDPTAKSSKEEKPPSDATSKAKERPKKAAAKTRLRNVRLASTPSNAAVYSIAGDGKRTILGYTPFRIKLPEGTASLAFDLAGHTKRLETLDVGRKTRAHSVVLEPLRIGTLQISTGADPSLKGATVFLDGIDIGFAPTAKAVKEGRYLVEVSHPARVRYKIWLDIREGERVVLAPVLSKAQDVKPVLVAKPAESPTGTTPKVYSLRPPADEKTPSSLAKEPAETPTAASAPKSGPSTAPANPVAAMPSSTNPEVESLSSVTATEEVPVEATSTPAIAAKVAAERPALPALAPTSSRLRIEANIDEAEVEVDGKSVGTAPLAIDVTPGPHRVTVKKAGHVPFELSLVTSGGLVSPVTAELTAIDMNALERSVSESKEEEALEHHMALAVGALPLRRGQIATTASLGYPNYAEVGAALGVGRASSRMWDARIGARTGLANWDVYGGIRVGLLQSGSFSLGVQGRLGGGAGSNSKQALWADGGVLGSVVVRSWFSLTAGMTLEAWSERLCPSGASTDSPPTSGPRVCTANATMEDLQRAASITGADDIESLDLGSRDLGARVVFSAAIDIPIDARWSVFGHLSSAPGQRERALHTDLFSSPMLGRDRGLSVNLGGMARF